MNQINRREFIKKIAVGAGSLGLAQLSSAYSSQFQSPPAPQAQATAQATPTPATTGTPAAQSPDLVVARGAGEPEDLVRRAMKAMGGMEKFVKKGMNVIIKPNMGPGIYTYEYASMTNPWVVGTLVKLCLEAGAAKVTVIDNPFGNVSGAYDRSGIPAQVKAAGGEIPTMSRFKFVNMKIPQGKSLLQAQIYEDILKADLVINAPIAKHHNLTNLTLGMKNLMGTVYDRPVIHSNIGQRLADLNSIVRPSLTVIDAIRILLRHGPTGGNLQDVEKKDTIIVSQDVVAADSYAAATLFNIKPDDLSFIPPAVAMGLGRSDYKNLKIEEVAIS